VTAVGEVPATPFWIVTPVIVTWLGVNGPTSNTRSVRVPSIMTVPPLVFAIVTVALLLMSRSPVAALSSPAPVTVSV
jgi:hypothetical protein